MPRAVPAAGGCSVSVSSMSTIPMPTESAAEMSVTSWTSPADDSSAGVASNGAIRPPTVTAIRCPPMTWRGEATTLRGGDHELVLENAALRQQLAMYERCRLDIHDSGARRHHSLVPRPHQPCCRDETVLSRPFGSRNLKSRRSTSNARGRRSLVEEVDAKWLSPMGLGRQSSPAADSDS